MATSSAAWGPMVHLRRVASAATRQHVALVCALFASGIGVTAPAQGQPTPNVRISTPGGDFLVDVRPLPAPTTFPQRQTVVADPQTPPRAVAMPSPVPAPALAPALALVPVPAAVAMPTPTVPPLQALQAPQTATTAQAPQTAQLSPPSQVPQTPPSPQPTQPAVTQNRAAMSAPAVSGTAPVAEPAQAAVEAVVRAWATAWSSKDISAYLASYGPDFAPEGKQARPVWEEVRRARIVGKSRINVKLSSLVVAVQGNRATAKFRQDYSADALNISSRKALGLVKVAGDRWVIVRESTGG